MYTERERERERERMKSSLLFMIFIITIDIYGLSSSLVNAQADSCSSNLSLSNSVPFDTASLHCLAVWDSQGFILRVSAPFMHQYHHFFSLDSNF